jgi:hypothetical protein
VVVALSLNILSGMARDTAGWRLAVTMLVIVQMTAGAIGLYAQVANVKIEPAGARKAPAASPGGGG